MVTKYINITSLPNAEVLRKLYNGARPFTNFGQYNPNPPQANLEDMTDSDAQYLAKATNYFQFLRGRQMYIDLSQDFLDASRYDAHNGEGAAGRALGLPYHKVHA